MSSPHNPFVSSGDHHALQRLSSEQGPPRVPRDVREFEGCIRFMDVERADLPELEEAQNNGLDVFACKADEN